MSLLNRLKDLGQAEIRSAKNVASGVQNGANGISRFLSPEFARAQDGARNAQFQTQQLDWMYPKKSLMPMATEGQAPPIPVQRPQPFGVMNTGFGDGVQPLSVQPSHNQFIRGAAADPTIANGHIFGQTQPDLPQGNWQNPQVTGFAPRFVQPQAHNNLQPQRRFRDIYGGE